MGSEGKQRSEPQPKPLEGAAQKEQLWGLIKKIRIISPSSEGPLASQIHWAELSGGKTGNVHSWQPSRRWLFPLEVRTTAKCRRLWMEYLKQAREEYIFHKIKLLLSWNSNAQILLIFQVCFDNIHIKLKAFFRWLASGRETTAHAVKRFNFSFKVLPVCWCICYLLHWSYLCCTCIYLMHLHTCAHPGGTMHMGMCVHRNVYSRYGPLSVSQWCLAKGLINKNF